MDFTSSFDIINTLLNDVRFTTVIYSLITTGEQNKALVKKNKKTSIPR